jgi:hypothetical protein
VLTAAFWNENVRDNSNAVYQSVQRLGYIQRTTDYNASTNSYTTAADVFASDLTWTADGTSSYQIEFYCPYTFTDIIVDTYLALHLVTGAGGDLGQIAFTGPVQVTNKRAYGTINVKTFYTPTAGSASINIRGVSASSGTAVLSPGTGFGGRVPMWLAIYGPNIT